MTNLFIATVSAHDEQAHASWLAWNGLSLRVPLANALRVGSQVTWAIASDQVRLPSLSGKPVRAGDTCFNARLVEVKTEGGAAHITVEPVGHPGRSLLMTVPASKAECYEIRAGAELVLHLRGESIRVTPAVEQPGIGVDWPQLTRLLYAFLGGAAIGTLGGLIGLGGAEFRLPLLIGMFGFAALPAVIMNKAMSLVVVAVAIVSRTRVVPADVVLSHWSIIANLLAGSLLGAWMGAGWATRLPSHALHRVIAALLMAIAVVLVIGHDHASGGGPLFAGWLQAVVGVVAGFGIGMVASLLGVAGGELLIPTLVLLFGADLKLAGSLSLAVSLPTMIVGFTRYSRDRSFAVLVQNKAFVFSMAGGSIMGAWMGGFILGVVPTAILLPILAVILVASAVKVWRHS